MWKIRSFQRKISTYDELSTSVLNSCVVTLQLDACENMVLQHQMVCHVSADPCLGQGRGGAWDRRRREACRWLCTGFALAIADWACHRFFGRLGHKVIGLTACNPDVWLPSNPSRQGTAATGCRLWHNGLFLPAFNPDVWPPSNASRRGTVATGSARGLKTWPTGCRLWHKGLFFTGFQSGRLAALKRFPAGYGCHWLC